MNMVAMRPRRCDSAAAFDLGNDEAYRRWRDWKLARQPASLDELIVDVRDPRALSSGERAALLACVARAGFALYRSQVFEEDRQLPRHLGAQLGLTRLDANWLAEEDGVSRITVGSASDGHGGFIPYTDRALGWHTDGYYHPQQRRIRGMVLHCVRPARTGGENSLLDPELAYIALRDHSPRLVAALMHVDAMTIPARSDESGIARPVKTGPVFSLDEDGCLHMRYTARTRSIEWKKDDATQEAVAYLAGLLRHAPAVWRVRLDAGMGLVGHNVLHDRSAFQEDLERPRLLLRARFLDRVRPIAEDAWRNG